MTPNQLAEAATLGSLLLKPAALEELHTWLRAEDFEDPWHQQLYRTLAEHRVARREISPQEVGFELLDRVGARRADLPRISGLLRVTPICGDPSAYAAMVLESSLRREVAVQGVLLRACALSASLNQGARPVIVGVDLVNEALREGERRWQRATGEPSSPSTAHPELAPALRHADRFLASDRLLSAHPEPDTSQVEQDERLAVSALICHPEQVDHVRVWLHPDWITSQEWRNAYEALLNLTDRPGRHVDAITVSWEVRTTASRIGPGPNPQSLLTAVDEAISADPSFYARRLASHLVRRTASSSARMLQAAADNLGLAIPEIFTTARVATAALRAAAQPLEGGHPGAHLQLVAEIGAARRVETPVAG